MKTWIYWSVLEMCYRNSCDGSVLGSFRVGEKSLGTAPGVASGGPGVIPAETTVVHAAVTGPRI